MQRSNYYGRGAFPGAKIRIPPLPDPTLRFVIKFTIGENLFADIKQFGIKPSVVCKNALRHEVAIRRKARRLRDKKRAAGQIINRSTGEVLDVSR